MLDSKRDRIKIGHLCPSISSAISSATQNYIYVRGARFFLYFGTAPFSYSFQDYHAIVPVPVMNPRRVCVNGTYGYFNIFVTQTDKQRKHTRLHILRGILYRTNIILLCQKQLSRVGTSNCIPEILWDVITCLWSCIAASGTQVLYCNIRYILPLYYTEHVVIHVRGNIKNQTDNLFFCWWVYKLLEYRACGIIKGCVFILWFYMTYGDISQRMGLKHHLTIWQHIEYCSCITTNMSVSRVILKCDIP